MTGLGQGDVGEDVHFEVPGVVGAAQVEVGLVGPHHEVTAAGDGYVPNAGFPSSPMADADPATSPASATSASEAMRRSSA